MLVIFLSLQRLEITEQRTKNQEPRTKIKDQRLKIKEQRLKIKDECGNGFILDDYKLNIRLISAIPGI
jgi:hypothetical protein